MLLGHEGAFRTVGNGHAEVEHAVIVLGREDEVVFAILLHHVTVPELLLSPGHLVLVEDDAMIGGGVGLHIVEGEHVVVTHLEVSAVVVEGSARLAVVRWVDVKTSVKHVGRRVGHVVLGEEIPCFHIYLYISIILFTTGFALYSRSKSRG